MVKRKCPKCQAEFDKKSTYDYHINRKTDCSQNNNNKNNNLNEIHPNPNNSISNPNYSILNPTKSNKEFHNQQSIKAIDIYNLENTLNVEKNSNILLCGFCSKSYSSKSNLNKHLKVCRVKKTNDEEKEKIFKFLLEKDKEKDKKIDELEKQNKILMDKIDKLININSKQMKTKTNTNSNNKITNSNNTTNTTNTTNTQNNIMMVNFGKEDLSVIDEKQFIERVIKKPFLSGVKIPDEVLKIIHFNPLYPQMSNIYISDINRDKCMVYEDGEWKLSSVDNIPQIMDKVCVFSAGQINALKTKHPDNKPLQDRLGTIEKYNNMIDPDYVDELRDDLETNKNQITRCEEFQAHTYNTLKKTMYNEGKKLRKNIRQIK